MIDINLSFIRAQFNMQVLCFFKHHNVSASMVNQLVQSPMLVLVADTSGHIHVSHRKGSKSLL